MSCDCQTNSGVGANNSRNERQSCECGSRCGCGSYYSCGINCRFANNTNNTMGAGTAGNCPSMQNNGFNSNAARISDLKLATTYVLPQRYEQSYTPKESLARGTCFPELDINY